MNKVVIDTKVDEFEMCSAEWKPVDAKPNTKHRLAKPARNHSSYQEERVWEGLDDKGL